MPVHVSWYQCVELCVLASLLGSCSHRSTSIHISWLSWWELIVGLGTGGGICGKSKIAKLQPCVAASLDSNWFLAHMRDKIAMREVRGVVGLVKRNPISVSLDFDDEKLNYFSHRSSRNPPAQPTRCCCGDLVIMSSSSLMCDAKLKPQAPPLLNESNYYASAVGWLRGEITSSSRSVLTLKMSYVAVSCFTPQPLFTTAAIQREKPPVRRW